MTIGDLVFYARMDKDGVAIRLIAKIIGFAPSGKVQLAALDNTQGRYVLRRMSVNDRMIVPRKNLPEDAILNELMGNAI